MPLFRFHSFNALGLVRDEEGQELPDHAAARVTALAAIRSIIADEAHQGRIDLRGRIEVRDEADRLLEVIQYSDAFEITLADSRP